MKNIIKALQRPLYAVAALAMLVGVVGTAVLPGLVKADDINNRSIKMSTSQVSATDAVYQVGFTLSATNAAASVAIDFCSNSPLVQQSCTAPTGMSVSALVNGGSDITMSGAATNDWDYVNAATTANHLEIGGTSAAAGTSIVLTLGGTHHITNPSTLGTFYARIYTYAAADPDWTAATTAGTYLDFGGIALSTAEAVQVTAIVQEKLVFCVSAVLPGTDCSGTTTPSLQLGSGSPKVIDDNGPYTGNVFLQASTNAQSGVVIRMKNSNAACTADANSEGGAGGLSRDGGTTCSIGPVGSGGGVAGGYTFTSGPSSAEFGLYCTPASANLTAASPYDGGGSTKFGMDTTTVGDNVTTTYGDTILSSASAINNEDATLTFGAQASLTTPAGIYTATMDLIATGTF